MKESEDFLFKRLVFQFNLKHVGFPEVSKPLCLCFEGCKWTNLQNPSVKTPNIRKLELYSYIKKNYIHHALCMMVDA